MAVISSQGLFHGERLAACSDKAKLYWPFLFIASNGFGRLELRYASIISEIFGNFSKPPKEEELWEIFEEYAQHFLVILYQANNVWWAQFDTSQKYLPKYKTVEDNNSPAPPLELAEKHRKAYVAWKLRNSSQNQRFQKFAETSENFLKVSEGKGVGIGVGEGVGEERKKQKHAPVAPFVLPDWIPRNTWDDFEAMRKRKRAGMDDSIRWRIVNRLEEFRIRGHDPIASLEKSIRSNYTDVFEVTGASNGKPTDKPSLNEIIVSGKHQDDSAGDGGSPGAEDGGGFLESVRRAVGT